MGNKKDVRNWFTSGMTYTQLMEERKKLVPVDTVLGDLADGYECDACMGSSECDDCSGSGEQDHMCDCEACIIYYDDCDWCDGIGMIGK